jgi:IMP dehydrogenase
MRLDQIMKRPLRTCQREDSLDQVAQMMWEARCGCVPVVNGGGCLVGTITDRDICMAAHFQGGPLYALKVQDAMSKGVIAGKPEDTIADAEEMMRSNRIQELPVVDVANRVVGILSLADLVGAALREASINEGGHLGDACCCPEDLIAPV